MMITAPQKYLFDVATYHKMGEAKLFSPTVRLELIAGEIIKMAPMGPVHADIISILDDLFHSFFWRISKRDNLRRVETKNYQSPTLNLNFK